MDRNKLLRQVTDYYLKSGDFNGTPTRGIKLSNRDCISIIEELIKDELITINFGDRHPNPHILAFDPEPVEAQIKKIKKVGLEHACLYPSKKHLLKVVDRSKYAGKPFTLMMAIGEPQLSYRTFDLSVLEYYKNDPRYHFNCDDIHGSLSIKHKFVEKGKVHKRDEIFLQTFGFAYNKFLTKRAVAVYIRYLSDLSPEHQQHWHNKMLRGKYYLHPDYLRTTMGHWPEKESIFVAFIEELHQINEMATLMGKPKFFKEEYSRADKPIAFGFLIRPTLKEFNDFVHLLDKLMSENINKDFFKGDVHLDFEEKMAGGRTRVSQKGTITLLNEWLKMVRFPDPKLKNKMIKVFRYVRKLRQSPAHAINENVFDQRYFSKQRKLIIDAYSAVRILRLILANHPKVRGYHRVPDWLCKAKIWTF